MFIKFYYVKLKFLLQNARKAGIIYKLLYYSLIWGRKGFDGEADIR